MQVDIFKNPVTIKNTEGGGTPPVTEEHGSRPFNYEIIKQPLSCSRAAVFVFIFFLFLFCA